MEKTNKFNNFKITDQKKFLYNFFINYGLYIAVLLVFLFFSIVSPYFLSWNNMLNLLTQGGALIVVSMGMTFVILTAGIDLSVGGILACSSIVGAQVMQSSQNIALGIGTIIFVGILFGCINGFIVVKLKIPAMIVTLGIMNITRGIGLVLTEGSSVAGLPMTFSKLGWETFLCIPKSLYISIVVFLLLFFVLSKSSYGRKLYAVGGSQKSSKIMGINASIIIFLAYVVSGLTAGIGGVIETARMGAARASMANAMELDAIASAIIGGTSFSGGRGTLVGTIIGAILITIINNGLNLLGVNYYYQIVCTGLIIVVAATIDQIKVHAGN